MASDLTPQEAYRLAYRYLRLKRAAAASFSEWDYAHQPTEEEENDAAVAGLHASDCERQMQDIRPLLRGWPQMVRAAAASLRELGAFQIWWRQYLTTAPYRRLWGMAYEMGLVSLSFDVAWRGAKNRYGQYRRTYVPRWDWRVAAVDSRYGTPGYRRLREEFLRKARLAFHPGHFPEPPGIRRAEESVINGREPGDVKRITVTKS